MNLLKKESRPKRVSQQERRTTEAMMLFNGPENSPSERSDYAERQKV
jgi:hypothetical protein